MAAITHHTVMLPSIEGDAFKKKKKKARRAPPQQEETEVSKSTTPESMPCHFHQGDETLPKVLLVHHIRRQRSRRPAPLATTTQVGAVAVPGIDVDNIPSFFDSTPRGLYDSTHKT